MLNYFLNNTMLYIWTNNLMPYELSVKIVLIFFLTILVGILGLLLNLHNILFTVFYIEIINISTIIILAIISKIMCDPKGYIYSAFLLWLTASESAVVLGIIVVLFKFGGTIKISSYNEMKG